jgi:hypothetical protein
MHVTRIFPKFSRTYQINGGETKVTGIGNTGNIYLNNTDLISKFRIFDSHTTADAKQEISNYLDVYNTGPLTKASMLQRMT